MAAASAADGMALRSIRPEKCIHGFNRQFTWPPLCGVKFAEIVQHALCKMSLARRNPWQVVLVINPREGQVRPWRWGWASWWARLGPTLGGWLTDSYSWRWVFFINIPIGVLATHGMWRYIRPVGARSQRFDIFGLPRRAGLGEHSC